MQVSDPEGRLRGAPRKGYKWWCYESAEIHMVF
jgi:hypothetical protein